MYAYLNVGYADDLFTPSLLTGGLSFLSSDGQVQLAHTLTAGSDTLSTLVNESLGGDLYLRLGLNPDRLLSHRFVPADSRPICTSLDRVVGQELASHVT